jgi:hypothetical protein
VRYCIALLLALVGVGSVRADIMFDNFNSPTPAQSLNVNSGILLSSIPIDLNNQILRRTQISANGGTALPTAVVHGGGVLSVIPTSQNYAITDMIYRIPDPADPNNFLGLPFNYQALNATGFKLNFQAASTNLQVSLWTLTSFSQVGGTTLTVNGPGSVFFPFTGNVDPTQIRTVQVQFNNIGVIGQFGLNGTGFVLDSIELTTSEPDPIPAPPAVFLALAALPALGLRKFFKKA